MRKCTKLFISAAVLAFAGIICLIIREELYTTQEPLNWIWAIIAILWCSAAICFGEDIKYLKDL